MYGQLWFNEEELEGFKRNQMYVYTATGWQESEVSKEDVRNTGVEGFSQNENQESRENSISNSIVLMDGGYWGEKSHLFGITEGITVTKDTEYISIGISLKNELQTGNYHLIYGFAPIPLGDITLMEYQAMLSSIYEEWHKVTPDELRNDYNRIETTIRVPKAEDLKPGYIGNTAPADTSLIWLDTTTGTYPKAKVYNEEWVLWNEIKPLAIDSYIYVHREFYGGYYKTVYTTDMFSAKYFFVAMSLYPSFNFEYGLNLPETATDRDSYFGINGRPDSAEDIVYRARFIDGEFQEWECIGLPTYAILNPPIPIPSPPFPGTVAVPIAGKVYWTDLKAETGLLHTAWSMHPDETYTRSYKHDETGIRQISGENEMMITDEEILAREKGERVFQISGNLTWLKYLESLKSKIAGLTTQEITLENDKKMTIMY